jgi:lipoate---protein ligase
MSTTPWPEFLT